MYTMIEHAKDINWWDGPDRFGCINRNQVADVQKETSQRMIAAFFKDGIGYDVGGPGIKYKEGFGIRGLNITEGSNVTADAQRMPFDDNYIDYIISSHTFEHIDNPELALKECIRVVKPEGLIYIVIPDKRYHLHSTDPSIPKELRAPSEMVPDDLEKLVNKFKDKVDILFFNARDNNFEVDVLMRVKYDD